MISMGFRSAPLAERAASGPPEPNGFAGAARRQVRHILSGPQYHSRPERTFQPLSGALAATGRWFERVFGPAWRWIGHHLFHPVGNWVTSDIGIPWPVAILVLALLAGVVAGVIRIRRRPRIDFEAGATSGVFQREDSEGLERLARQAELAGDLRAAIRLRFRAGVADLDKLGVISRGPTRTTAELSSALSSAQFDELAADLEAVVYGEIEPTPKQADLARSGWPVVVSQAALKAGPLKRRDSEGDRESAGTTVGSAR
jgi:hypothetical protein